LFSLPVRLKTDPNTQTIYEKLPEKTVERLSQYRRVLLTCLQQGKYNIYSHELANLLHLNPVQVRRDIMLIGHSGTLRKGYDVKKLSDMIGEIIDSKKPESSRGGCWKSGACHHDLFSGEANQALDRGSFRQRPGKPEG
jgi:redox-sensing transcriptional repressor